MMDTLIYDPRTSKDVYEPFGKNGQQYSLHAIEKKARDLAEVGVFKFFEGPGPDPTRLAGYDVAGVWLRQQPGPQAVPGDLRVYSGSGAATDEANWVALTYAGYKNMLGIIDPARVVALETQMAAIKLGADPSVDTFLEAYNRFVTDEALVATKADASALTAHTARTDNPHSVTKAQVGLGNVDNTSDASKPVSTLQAAADASVQAFAIQRGNHTGTQLAATISDFGATTIASVLTGFTAAGTRTAVTASDTVLAAFGKVQKYFNDLAAVAFSGSASDLSTGTLPAARLPVATASTLGGVKQGTGTSIAGDGTISVTGGGGNVTGPGTSAVNNVALFNNTTGTLLKDGGTLATVATSGSASDLGSGTLAAARGGAGTVSGLMKANGSGTVSAAVSGTDYAPATSGSAVLKGNGAGGFSSAAAGTDYQAPIGTISGIAKGNGANALTAATAGTDYVAPGGALGTPSSGTLTNCTSLPVTALTGTPVKTIANDFGNHLFCG